MLYKYYINRVDDDEKKEPDSGEEEEEEYKKKYGHILPRVPPHAKFNNKHLVGMIRSGIYKDHNCKIHMVKSKKKWREYCDDKVDIPCNCTQECGKYIHGSSCYYFCYLDKAKHVEYGIVREDCFKMLKEGPDANLWREVTGHDIYIENYRYLTNLNIFVCMIYIYNLFIYYLYHLHTIYILFIYYL